MIVSQPDAGGHFGPYGGRYVPEVLMAPLEELEQAYMRSSRRCRVSGRAEGPAGELRRPAHAVVLRAAAEPRSSAARASISSAKTCCTPARTRSTTALGQALLAQAHGQAADHRRDRRRPARRRDGDRVRAVRAGVRRLHGRGRHAAAAAECLPHAAARAQKWSA